VVDRAISYRLRPPSSSRQITPEQAQEVVLAGNIGKFSLALRQPGKGLSLPTRRLTDDDLGAALAAGPSLLRAGVDFVLKISARREKGNAR
jgi:Flp pilus assembly protein CpaB